MVVLGVLLMLACAALAVDAVIQNAAGIGATVFSHPVAGLSLGAVFVAGAVIGLLFALGLALFTRGVSRRLRHRRQRTEAAAVERPVAYPEERATAPAVRTVREPADR